jgi:hypothetical protein
MSCRWLQRSWTRRQWAAVSEKPWSGVRVSHDDTRVKKMELSETIGVTLKDRCTLQLVHLDLSNNNLDSFLKNIGGPEKGRFTLLGHPSKNRVFLRTHRSCLFHIQPPPRPLDQWPNTTRRKHVF